MATLVVSPVNSTLNLSGNQGQIDLNYVITDPDNSFSATQIAATGFEIYFSDEIAIDVNDIIVPSSVGTIPPIAGRLTIDDSVGNADGDPNTVNASILTFQPLFVSETETLFISIPFSTTGTFDGTAEVNFISREATDNLDAVAVNPVTITNITPGQLVITPISTTISSSTGEIVLNYRLENFDAEQIASIGLEIYFSNEIAIDADGISIPDSVGDIPAIAGILAIDDSVGNADGDPDTVNSVVVTVQPLFVSDTDTLLITIPFSTTAEFDGTTQVNFISRGATEGLEAATIAPVTVTNVNEAPTIVSPDDFSVEFAENSTAIVLDIDADDPEGDAITFALVTASVDASLFSINRATGELTFVTAPNFEDPDDAGANNVYNLQIQVSDGTNTITQAVTVTVTDVNEAPTVSLLNSVTVLSEGLDTSTRIKVADININDDAQGTNTTSLSGADASLFQIVGTELYLKAGSDLDFQTNPQLDVLVSVDDSTIGSTPDSSAELTIAVEAVALNLRIDDNNDALETVKLVFDPTGDGNVSLAADNVTDRTDAVFDNLVGLYEVIDATGRIQTENGVLNPEDPGYALAALDARVENFTLRAGAGVTTIQRIEQSGDVVLEGGKFYAPFVIANGGAIGVDGFIEKNPDNDAAETVSDTVAYFSFVDANPDGVGHLRSYGNGVFGFEDLPGNLGVSDNDFNDAVFAFDFTA